MSQTAWGCRSRAQAGEAFGARQGCGAGVGWAKEEQGTIVQLWEQEREGKLEASVR